MTISPRYAAVTGMLLACALVPTVIHSYWGLTIDDGLRTAAIPQELAGMRSQPTGRKAHWAETILGSQDFVERTYNAGGEDVQLFVGRSFDAKRLYHHPELAILRGTATAPAGLARLPGRPDVPIHVLTTTKGGRRGVAVYALLYDGTYVERPILFQMATAGRLLFNGRRAMTLFLASDSAGSLDRLDAAPALRLLTAAIDAFEAQAAAGN